MPLQDAAFLSMTDHPTGSDKEDESEESQVLHEARLWRDNGWTAQVIKNEDDEGWAVAMYKVGQPEPALVAPWTMGRDKKNPKPLDANAFNTWVKTASEVVRRHEQHLQATLHQQITVEGLGQRIQVSLDIVPDDEDPQATLSAHDAHGELLAQVPASPGFKLNRASAMAWVQTGFTRPR